MLGTNSAGAVPSGSGTDPDDCDDEDETINPDAVELCDGVDNDCDGETDGTLDVDCALNNATSYAYPDRYLPLQHLYISAGKI